MFGKARQTLEGLPFTGFVVPSDRTKFTDFLRRYRAGAGAGAGAGRPDFSLDLSVKTADGPKPVQLICRIELDERGGPRREMLMSMIDISERVAFDAERAKAARDHAALASRLLTAQDEERQRIARDLHDHVGQQVTALRLLLQAAQTEASKNGDVRGRIERAQSVIEQLDRQLDFLTTALRPASLDLGLTSAATQFVHDWSATFGITAEIECRGLEHLRLDGEVETHVYRILQEALNNTHKHAHATRVHVRLGRRTTDLVVTVEDDGCGFDVGAMSRHHGRGLGLIGMRERAQLIDASIEIHSAPSKGTSIVLRVPIAGRTGSR
jgi:signal transduction histidine kinase